MNIPEQIAILNDTLCHTRARLSNILVNLRGEVPQNDAADKIPQASGLCGQVQRVCSTSLDIMQMLSEVETLTGQPQHGESPPIAKTNVGIGRAIR